MCLVALALGQSARFPLVLASNRDEFFDRPTAPLGWWQPETGGPAILGGRDLRAGGTWLGLTSQGRLALVTNVRQGLEVDPKAPSRGSLVPGWLSCDEPFDAHWVRLSSSRHSNFNLIAADIPRGDWRWAGSSTPAPARLAQGVHGLSNAALDTPWPKVRRLKEAVAAALAESEGAVPTPQFERDATSTGYEPPECLVRLLFEALADGNEAADAELPDTGIPLDLERRLSAAFIREPEGRYGTRCSTLVVTERLPDGLVTHVIERSFAGGPAAGAIIERRTRLVGWASASEGLDAGEMPQVIERVLPR